MLKLINDYKFNYIVNYEKLPICTLSLRTSLLDNRSKAISFNIFSSSYKSCFYICLFRKIRKKNLQTS
jgi:hypothetical protein